MWAGRLNKIYGSVLVMCMIMTYSTTKAQFQNSSVNETMMPGSSGTYHIHEITNYTYSNLAFPDFTSDLYVTTMGIGNPKLYYKRSHSGSPMSIIDEGIEIVPGGGCYDAVILNNPNVAAGSAYKYCVLVAHSDVGGTYLSFYEWQTTGLSLISTHQISTNVTHTLSLDAHGLYAYTAVWYEFPGYELYAMGGFTPQPAMYPLVGTPKEIISIGSGGKGRLPDVAMTKIENPTTDEARTGLRLYHTYYDQNLEFCYVSSLAFDHLMTLPSPIASLGVASVTPQFPFSSIPLSCATGLIPYPPFAYAYLPKIDAPDHSDGAWAMVTTQFEMYPFGSFLFACNNAQSSFVSSLILTAYQTSTASPVYQHALNDGGLTGTVKMSENHFPPYTDILPENIRPTVAWSQDGQYINYAWAKTQEHAALGDHDYIGLLLDPFIQDAVPAPSGDGYRVIDFDISLDPLHGGRCIAFTRQNDASNDLFVVFDADSANLNWVECLYYKHVDWNNIPSIGYRGENNNKTKLTNDGLIANYYPNPANNKFVIELNALFAEDDIMVSIFDIQGREIKQLIGKIYDINPLLQNYIEQTLSEQMLLIRVSSLTSAKSENIKIITGTK